MPGAMAGGTFVRKAVTCTVQVSNSVGADARANRTAMRKTELHEIFRNGVDPTLTMLRLVLYVNMDVGMLHAALSPVTKPIVTRSWHVEEVHPGSEGVNTLPKGVPVSPAQE